jgi:membrane protein DedA with SNARE-associated domain/rhodanese-related sulfurtransferase
MHDVATLVQNYGLLLVFAVVLVESLGLPVPSFAVVLIAAGSSAAAGHGPFPVLLVALAASVLGDLFWYWAGMRYGYRLLGTLCRISISPESCVQRTESLFVRWGPSSLLISRFVPGFSVLAQPLAGAVGQPFSAFFVYDSLGALIWCTLAVALGVIFSAAVDNVLDTLDRYGAFGGLLVLAAFAAFLLYKWARRQLFIRSLRMARITVDELHGLILRGDAPVILDVRPSELQERDGVIPGAIPIVFSTLDSVAMSFDSSAEVIVYCACPNEASAATIAHRLIQKGAKRVRPLLGGVEAWVAAGLELTGASSVVGGRANLE